MLTTPPQEEEERELFVKIQEMHYSTRVLPGDKLTIPAGVFAFCEVGCFVIVWTRKIKDIINLGTQKQYIEIPYFVFVGLFVS